MGAPQRQEDVKAKTPERQRHGSSKPLIVVDGNVWGTYTNKFDFSSANKEKFAELINVNPEDIESINVLKGAAATDIWGSQGSNGVIDIKTKRAPEQFIYRQYPYMFKISH
ncbi:MAG: TonB-dependent receptor plug domain-containing protein [Prevotella sp.]|nr:TonB-dependent receptor plug domain-containing protein [Prevotella sp.]